MKIPKFPKLTNQIYSYLLLSILLDLQLYFIYIPFKFNLEKISFIQNFINHSNP